MVKPPEAVTTSAIRKRTWSKPKASRQKRAMTSSISAIRNSCAPGRGQSRCCAMCVTPSSSKHERTVAHGHGTGGTSPDARPRMPGAAPARLKSGERAVEQEMWGIMGCAQDTSAAAWTYPNAAVLRVDVEELHDRPANTRRRAALAAVTRLRRGTRSVPLAGTQPKHQLGGSEGPAPRSRKTAQRLQLSARQIGTRQIDLHPQSTPRSCAMYSPSAMPRVLRLYSPARHRRDQVGLNSEGDREVMKVG